MKGTVMKITKDNMVVLCEDGKFRNLPVPQILPQLGEKIVFSKPPAKKKENIIKWSAVWVAAVFLIFIISGAAFFAQIGTHPEAEALVAIDINPSMEMLLDSNSQVKDVFLLNMDAKELFTKEELIGKDFYAAWQIIISKAEEQNYLDKNTEKVVMISIVDLDDASLKVDLEKIKGKEYDLKVNYVDKKVSAKAKKEGLTVNKYLVYEQAKKEGIKLDKEHLRQNAVDKSLMKAGVNAKAFLKKSMENQEADKQQEGKAGKKQNPEKADKSTDDIVPEVTGPKIKSGNKGRGSAQDVNKNNGRKKLPGFEQKNPIEKEKDIANGKREDKGNRERRGPQL